MRNTEVRGNKQSYCESAEQLVGFISKRTHVIRPRQFTHRRNVGFIRSAVVVAQQSVELQRVELEAGVVDVLHILHGVFVHGEESCCLERQGDSYWFIVHLTRTEGFKPFRPSATFVQTRTS